MMTRQTPDPSCLQHSGKEIPCTLAALQISTEISSIVMKDRFEPPQTYDGSPGWLFMKSHSLTFSQAGIDRLALVGTRQWS